MASRADERMVLDTMYSHGVVRDHVGQNQLGATGITTHLTPERTRIERPPGTRSIGALRPDAEVPNYPGNDLA